MEGTTADDEKHGDISFGRVDDDPMRLTTFGVQESIGTPALSECSNNALVDEGAEASKPRFLCKKVRKSTLAGGLLHAGSASTYKAQRRSSLPNVFLGASEKRSRRVLVRQLARHLPSTTVPATARLTKRNQGKTCVLTQADGQVVCAAFHFGRRAHVVLGGG